jgi:hypothetical protein
MNKKEKNLVFNALTYTKSPSYWGMNNVRNYLRELKNIFNEVFIIIHPTELQNRIIQWIDKCDPNLDIFMRFNKEIELEKAKTCQLFEIPSNIASEIADILMKQKEVPYDALSMGTWDNPKLVFSKKKGNLFEMWYAVKASKHATKIFDIDNISDEVRNSLFSMLQESVPDVCEIEKIHLDYNIFDRIINITTFNIDQKKVSISTDQPKLTDPDDSEKNKTRPEDRLGPLFDKILTSVGVSKKSTESIIEKKRVNINSVKRIRVKETKTLLLFPFRFDTIYNAGDLTAANVTKFTKLNTKNVLPIINEYYEKHNTFTGFFKAHSNLDAQANSEILRTIINIPNIEDEAEGFFLFIIHNSEIHVARIICNITTGSLRIFLEKGNGTYEQVTAELDRLFS